MAELVLKDERIVTLSDEDYEWARQFSWRAWLKAPDAQPQIVCDETRCVEIPDPEQLSVRDGYRAKRIGPTRTARFRRRMHREIAARMNPSLTKAADRLQVRFKNGDPFDVRRENLIIKVRPLKRGRPFRDARPKGYAKKVKKARLHDRPSPREPSDLWNPGL